MAPVRSPGAGNPAEHGQLSQNRARSWFGEKQSPALSLDGHLHLDCLVRHPGGVTFLKTLAGIPGSMGKMLSLANTPSALQPNGLHAPDLAASPGHWRR